MRCLREVRELVREGAIMQVVLQLEQHCGVVGVAEPASTLDNRPKL